MMSEFLEMSHRSKVHYQVIEIYKGLWKQHINQLLAKIVKSQDHSSDSISHESDLPECFL